MPYRGQPLYDGNFDAPAVAMARGVFVDRSTLTVALAAVGVVPYGFLTSEVTTDGPSYEERVHIPGTVHDEVKVSEGKVGVLVFQIGMLYITAGNIKAGTTFAVGEFVVVAASGEFTDDAGAATGNQRVGRVDAINVTYAGETCFVWKAEADLGTSP